MLCTNTPSLQGERTQTKEESSVKRDSVLDDHSSGTIIADGLMRRYRGSEFTRLYKYSRTWSCFSWGLPNRNVSTLLVSSYLTVSFSPLRGENASPSLEGGQFITKVGTFFSVALSIHRCMLPLAANLPLEVPTFLPVLKVQSGHLDNSSFLREPLLYQIFVPFSRGLIIRMEE